MCNQAMNQHAGSCCGLAKGKFRRELLNGDAQGCNRKPARSPAPISIPGADGLAAYSWAKARRIVAARGWIACPQIRAERRAALHEAAPAYGPCLLVQAAMPGANTRLAIRRRMGLNGIRSGGSQRAGAASMCMVGGDGIRRAMISPSEEGTHGILAYKAFLRSLGVLEQSKGCRADGRLPVSMVRRRDGQPGA